MLLLLFCTVPIFSSAFTFQVHNHSHFMFLQAALTKRITNRARLEEVARCVIASSTDKLFEVGLDEHKVRLLLGLSHPMSP